MNWFRFNIIEFSQQQFTSYLAGSKKNQLEISSFV